MHSAIAPKLDGGSPGDPSCLAGAGRDTMWEGSSVTPVPVPRPPPLLGRSRLAQVWQQIRTVMLSCLWSPWLCMSSPHPHSHAPCKIGQGRNYSPVFYWRHQLISQGHAWMSPWHSWGTFPMLKSNCPSILNTNSQQPCWRLLTVCSLPSPAVCESGVPLRWRSAVCPWSSPSEWILTYSPLSGTLPGTPPKTSFGSACPQSHTPVG